MRANLFDLLDPVQLGFIYESLMNNANDTALNSKGAQVYINAANEVKDAITFNCGWRDYLKLQPMVKKLADYDGRQGFK